MDEPSTATRRTLLVLRHAQAGNPVPGTRDADRPLTEAGRRRAVALGEQVTLRGWRVDAVLCSPAVRTRETLAGLGLDPAPTVRIVDRLYQAGSDEIIDLVRELGPEVGCALVVGHAPGVPSVVYELADAYGSDPRAVAQIEGRYPAGTLAVLQVCGDWSDLADVTLTDVLIG